MEISFSAKPQALSAITCAPISSCFAPGRVRSLGREFLGSGHTLRPPGFRSRRKCKKLGFQFRVRSPNFLFKASLDSQSALVVVAVATVTVSALTVVYFNYSSKRKMNVKEMSQQLSVALSQQIRSIMNWGVLGQFLRPSDIPTDTFASEKKNLVNEMRDYSHVYEDVRVEEQCNQTVLTNGQTLVPTVSEPPHSNVVASTFGDSLSSNKSGSTGSSSELSIVPESDAPTFTFATEASGMHLEGCRQETEVCAESPMLMVKTGLISASSDAGQTLVPTASGPPDSNVVASTFGDSLSPESGNTGSSSELSILPELDAPPFTFAIEASGMHLEGGRQETEVFAKSPVLMVKTGLSAASSDATCIQAGTNELGGANHGHAVEVATSSLTFTPTETVRKELHTFYEASSTNIYNPETFSSHATVQENGGFSSMMKGSIIVGRETSSSENWVGKGPHGCLQEGFSPRSNDSGKREEFSINNEKTVSHHNTYKSLFLYPNQKAKHINSRCHPSRKFSAYNEFLREGRLTECIQMLEDLESKGLLDMDNVYHAGFFRACKKQKAVKEAFQFTRLIPNPTLSTFNMLMSVCASSQDSEGAFQVLHLVREAGYKADCKLYTTLISTCAKSGKVDTMFEVFHEMVNAGIEPNLHTYGALIDGCAKAGQVAKAFGAYGILRSKNVKPDRVVFNALITACGQSGAVDRAFDVLGEMRTETQPIDPDHITVGALMKACVNAGQVERAREVYNMIDEYNIQGTPEVYTIAINSCSQGGDWEFACRVYDDMMRKGVAPDEILISALIDVAGHADKVDAAFEVLEEAKIKRVPVGVIAYSSLMGACSNAKSWQKALDLYEDIKGMNLKPTVSMMNALITALCDADQLQKAVEALLEMKRLGLSPNTITYSILLVASEKKDDLEIGLTLLSQAKKDGVVPNLVMCRCLIAMCLRRYQKACKLGEPVLSSNSGRLQLDSKWTSLALRVYRETIAAGVAPTAEELSQVLGCLQLPYDAFLKKRLIEDLGVCTDTSRGLNLCSLLDGFGEYDPRAFSLLEEAASRGIIPVISFSESPIVIDVRDLQVSTAEVYILAVVRGLKHRLAADGPGARLPNITILLPIEDTEIQTPIGEKTVNLAGRMTQTVAALLRRLGLPQQGKASHGKVRIFGIVLKKWLRPKINSSFSGNSIDLSSSQTRLGKEIFHQQRNIRTGNLSLD